MNKHKKGLGLTIVHDKEHEDKVIWDNADQITDQIRRTWNDIEEATEWGATGLAFVVILQHTEYTVINCSRRGTGFDYWLGHKEAAEKLVFQNEARLEVSGMLREEKDSRIKQRVREKLDQTARSDHMQLQPMWW